MKKFVFFLSLFVLIGNIKAQVPPLTLTITNTSSSNSITCNNLSLNFLATSNDTSMVSYFWASATNTLFGAYVSITHPGTYTVLAVNANSATASQTISVSSNTVAPVSVLSPTFQNITCNITSVSSITANASNSNITHMFMSPQGGNFVANTSSVAYTPLATGTFTYILTDNINGCKTTKNFTITSSQGLPTFSVTSPQNFTLGCSTKSVAIISINNADTTPIPGGPVSYTILSPGSSTATAAGALSANSVYTVNTPGTWIIITKDNTSLCETRVPVSILQNTFAPNQSVNIPSQILNCTTHQVQLQAFSNNSNVSHSWSFPGTPGNISGDSIIINTKPSQPTSTLIANYTLVTTDNFNFCKSTTVIPMYQNLFPPTAIISSGGVYTLTCATPTIQLTNQSTTGIPSTTGFPNTAPVIGYIWHGPSPQTTLGLSTTYLAYTAGQYTLTAKDINNGCTSSGTYNVFGGCNTVGIYSYSYSDVSVSTFPNPNNGEFTLLIEKGSLNSKLEIYNTLGVLIKAETLSDTKNEIDLQNETNGVYIIRIKENDTIIYTSKILKH